MVDDVNEYKGNVDCVIISGKKKGSSGIFTGSNETVLWFINFTAFIKANQ